MPAVRSHTAANMGLELAGTHVGWLSSVTGGAAIGEVILDPPSTPGVQRKHLGAVRYEDIVLTCGAGMGAPFWTALQGVLKGDKLPHDGAVVAYDMNFVARERLEFTAALITQVTFPALDASSKSPALLRVRLAPQRSRRRAAGGAAGAPAGATKPKTFVQSNFRVSIDGLDAAMKRVSKVAALTVSRPAGPTARPPGAGHPAGSTEISDLVLSVSPASVKALETWHEEFVVKGNPQERTGAIELLTPDLADVLLRLELRGLGIYRLNYDAIQPATDQSATVTASMYCEQVTIAATPAAG